MALIKIGGCDDGTCPTVWRQEDSGALFVQGYEATPAELAAVGDVPPGEGVVRLPADVLAQAAATLDTAP